MAWQLTDDVGAYLAAAGGFLRANAVQNTITIVPISMPVADSARGRDNS